MECLPTPNLVAKLITSLFHLTQNRDESILIYTSFKGAAWIAVFAAHILDLPTCVVGAEGELPVNSHYGTARVILRLDEDAESFRVTRRISIPHINQILCARYGFTSSVRDNMPPTLDKSYDIAAEWQFDCSEIRFLDICLTVHLDSALLELVSDAVAATVLASRVREARWSTLTSEVLPEYQQATPNDNEGCRMLEVLSILGYRVLTPDDYHLGASGEFIRRPNGEAVYFSLRPFGALFKSSNWTGIAQDQRTASCLACTSLKAAALAKVLASTDWASSWRKLPLSAISTNASYCEQVFS